MRQGCNLYPLTVKVKEKVMKGIKIREETENSLFFTETYSYIYKNEIRFRTATLRN